MIRSLAVSFAVCFAAACASSGSSASQTSDSTAATPQQASVRRSPTLITEQELTASTARDGLHAVQVLRPDWLRPRGAASLNGQAAEVVIYLNGQRFGGPDALKQFQPAAIKEMRYMSASEATNRFGTGHNSGAILLRTK